MQAKYFNDLGGLLVAVLGKYTVGVTVGQERSKGDHQETAQDEETMEKDIILFRSVDTSLKFYEYNSGMANQKEFIIIILNLLRNFKTGGTGKIGKTGNTGNTGKTGKIGKIGKIGKTA